MSAISAPSSNSIQNTPPPQASTTTPIPPSLVSQTVAPNQGAVEVSATPAATPPSRMHAASISPEENQHQVEREVRWCGKKYILRIDGGSEEFADYFTKNLLKNLDNQQGIKPGENCEIMFDDAGYTIYSTPKGFNALDPKAFEKIPPEKKFPVTDPEAKALSEILTSVAPTVENYEATLNEKLRINQDLSTLRGKVNSEKAEQSINKPPAKLKQTQNSCYLNTAFQQLANDPILAEELSNPKNFKDGEKDKLFIAIQAYRKAQANDDKTEINIVSILDVDVSKQMDVKDAWAIFATHISDQGNHPRLKSIFVDRTVQVVENGNLSDLTKDLLNEEDDLPEVLSIQTNRINYGEIPKDWHAKLSNEEIKTIYEALRECEYIPSGRTTDQEEGEKFEDSFPLVDDQRLAIQEILGNETKLQEALKKLPQDSAAKNLIHKHRYPSSKKIEHPITVDNGVVKIGGQKYKIASFAFHDGVMENGHYVAYVKKGNQYYVIDDRGDVKSINDKQFYEKAKTAAFYTLHKENPADSSTSQTTTPTAETNEPIEKVQRIKSTDLTIESGNMNVGAAQFTLINPMDEHMQTNHDQMEPILSRGLSTVIEKVQSLESPIRKGLRKITGPKIYQSGDILPATQFNNYYVILMATKKPESQEEVDQIVKDALEQAMKDKKKDIVFPVIGNDYSQTKVAITKYLQENENTYWNGGHIKIVAPKGTKSIESSVEMPPNNYNNEGP